jgi:hypothetical protein
MDAVRIREEGFPILAAGFRVNRLEECEVQRAPEIRGSKLRFSTGGPSCRHRPRSP